MKKIFLTGLIVAVAAIQAFALTLVNDGKCDYDIVIRSDAPENTRYAASELETYLKKAAGATVKTLNVKAQGRKAIYVGGHPELPKTAEFDPEKYNGSERFRIVELAGNDLAIMGADCDVNPVSRKDADFGLLFGVYEFIERFLGVRWYAPGEFGECYEKKSVVEVAGLPIEITPIAWARMFWPYIWNEFDQKDAAPFNRRLRAFGLRDGCANHSMMDMYFYIKDSKPELFALETDGKSRNQGRFKPGTSPEDRQWARYPQYCFSNPETVKAYCDFIDAVYENRPEGKLWRNYRPTKDAIYVVPDDNYTTEPCYCPDCKKLIRNNAGRASMSPLVWGFVKQIAEWAKQKYPDKKIMTLAYESYYLPPDFELPDNVVVQICVNPYIIYHGAKQFRDAFGTTLKAWSTKVNEISVWHYLTPYDDIPYAMPHIMDQWFRDYPKVKSVFLELNDTALRKPNLPRHPSHQARGVNDLPQSHLNIYFAMKSLAGCRVDVDAELELYYKLFYGPASVPMKRFYDCSIKAWENVGSVAGGDSGYPKFSGKELYEQIYNKDIVKTMRDSINEAKELAPADSIYQKRLAWIEDGFFKQFSTAAEAYFTESSRSKELILSDLGKAPKFDGDLDDSFWQKLTAHQFVKYDAPLPPRFPTEFKLGLAEGKLWFGIRAQDPDSSSQIVNVQIHDGVIYEDDSIEIFIRPGSAEQKSFKNVSVNLAGIILDYMAGDRKLDKSYESGAVAKVKRQDGFYTMVVMIPLDGLGIDSNVFGLNVCRNKYSGVGENRERSAWNCPFGNFWNFNNMPTVRLIGKDDVYMEDFVKPVYHGQTVQTRPDDKYGPLVQKGCRKEMKNGIMTLFYQFDESNHRYDHGIYTPGSLSKPIPLNGARFIEIRFRNPDAGLSHTITWSYKDASGKQRGDWMRFCNNEAHPEWRIRKFDIANDGHNAQQRTKKGETNPDPTEIIGIQIYSTPLRDNIERHIDLDYIRVTK